MQHMVGFNDCVPRKGGQRLYTYTSCNPDGVHLGEVTTEHKTHSQSNKFRAGVGRTAGAQACNNKTTEHKTERQHIKLMGVAVEGAEVHSPEHSPKAAVNPHS